MSSYYHSFDYQGINSYKDKNLIVTTFNADNGESDTYLEMEPVYTESYDGTRLDYGAKYSSVAVIRITVIKADGTDFSVADVRDFLKWTTGARNVSYLDLLDESGQIKYSFLGRVTNAFQQKMDGRTIGLILEYTCNTPFAYSPVQKVERSIIGEETFTITNDSDDIYSYVYPKVTYTNASGDYVVISNTTTNNIGDSATKITGLISGETITIENNMMILSSTINKTFGDTFNFVFPRLAAGDNEITIDGIGTITFEYIYPIKIGNCAIDIDVNGNGLNCSGGSGSSSGGNGTVIVEELSWENITNKPTTISGYGITDAYTMKEIDTKFNNISTGLSINEQELQTALAEVLI